MSNEKIEEVTEDAKKAKKGKRRNSKSKRDSRDSKDKGKFRNDPSFYFKDPILMDQVSSFSFNEFLGNPTTAGYDIPYAMRLLFNPSPGWTDGWNDGTTPSISGINVAARKLYTRLSSGNAKTTNYAPQDVAMLMLALGDVISIGTWIKRTLKLAFTYNKRNWAYPKWMISVTGFKANDVLNNLAKYRMRYNTIINMINQIAFPREVTWFKKCEFMYSHIFLDSESPMAQSYVFVPYSLWNIMETTNPSGTELSTLRLWGSAEAAIHQTLSMNVVMNYFQVQIQQILDSSTFNYIFSDVLRLYNGDEFVTLPFLAEDEVIMPVYDPMVNLQINNLTIITAPADTNPSTSTKTSTHSNDVISDADTNSIIYRPNFGYTSNIYNRAFNGSGFFLNFPHSMGNPDVYQRIESTRMTSFVSGILDKGVWTTNKAALADHYCVAMIMYEGEEFDVNVSDRSYVVESSAMEIAGNSVNYQLDLLAKLEHFDYAPRVIIYYGNGASQVSHSGDLDFFTSIDMDYLIRVNNLAYTTLFDV